MVHTGIATLDINASAMEAPIKRSTPLAFLDATMILSTILDSTRVGI
jgi:hypothetical protein